MTSQNEADRRKTWTLIASGPSLSPDQVNYCRGKSRVLAINDNYRLAPWADCLYACDSKWWKWHKDDQDLIDFEGEKWTQNKSWSKEDIAEITSKHKLFCIESTNQCGLSESPERIYQGMNSGFQAINLAYHFGARKIILIGYDMKLGQNDKAHWFGDHPDKIKSNYLSWIPLYGSLAEHAKRIGLDIVNCSLDTDLTCFRRSILEEQFN